MLVEGVSRIEGLIEARLGKGLKSSAVFSSCLSEKHKSVIELQKVSKKRDSYAWKRDSKQICIASKL